MTEIYNSAKAGIENVLYIYLNMYVAFERWIDANVKEPTLEIIFDDVRPKLEAKSVVASADYLMGAALIHTVMQLGRIVDHYFQTVLTPLIGGAVEDNTWYSPEAIELISRVPLVDVFGFNSFVTLNGWRISIEALSNKTELTQVQVLTLADNLVQFLSEFDARLEFENSNRKKVRKNGKVNPKDGGPASGDDSASSAGGGDRPLPRFMLGPSGFVSRPGHNDGSELNPGYPDDSPDPRDEDCPPEGFDA